MTIRRTYEKEKRTRAWGIIDINILNGYYSLSPNGTKITSAPILIYELGPLLKQAQSILTPEQSDDFVEAGSIL